MQRNSHSNRYPTNRVGLGILYMLGASACFAVMSLLRRGALHSLPALEAGFFRTALTLLVLTPWMLRRRVSLFGKSRLLLLFRGTVGAISLVLGFYALTVSPVADVVVLWKSSAIFTAFLSILFLKERVTPSLVGWIVLGFIGTTLIVKPSGDFFNMGGLAALGAGFLLALVGVSVKKLHDTEHAMTIIYSFCLWGSVITYLGGAAQFVMPTSTQILPLVLLGVSGTVGQLWFTEAFKYAPASIVQPYSFSEVLLSAIGAAVIWGEIPDRLALLGGVVIVVSCIGILRLQRPRAEG